MKGLLIPLVSLAASGALLPLQSVSFPSRPSEPPIAIADGASPGSAALSGHVTDGLTGVALPGATVSLIRAGARQVAEQVSTDSKGRFVFASIAAGSRYAVRVEHPAYWPAHYGESRPALVESRQPPEFSLDENQWRRDANIAAWPTSTISGRVLDERGEPIVGATVRPFMKVPVGPRQLLAGGAPTLTDDQGFYRFVSLMPGDYWVAVLNSQPTVSVALPESAPRRAVGALFTGGPPDRGPASFSGPALLSADRKHRSVLNPMAVTASTDDGRARVYPSVFYPDSASPEGTDPIALTFGSHREHVDFRLTPVRAFSVSGRARRLPKLGPVPLLRLVPRGREELGLGSEVATTTLEPDGRFTFLAVPAGDYSLVWHSVVGELTTGATAPRAPNPPGLPDSSVGSGFLAQVPLVRHVFAAAASSDAWLSADVSVRDADVEDLDVTFRATVAIRGRIEGDILAVLPPGQRGFFVSGEPADGDVRVGRPSADADRGPLPVRFELTGLVPARYLMRSSHFPVVSVTWQGRDVTEDGVDANSGDVSDVVITVSGQRSELTGTLGPSASVTPLSVVVFPAERRLWANVGWTPRRLRSAPVRGDGTYQLLNLPSGTYYVAVVDAPALERWMYPEELDRLSRRASRVSITWGQRVVHDLARPAEVR